MYSTCLFCNKPLGSNEVVEAFPIGRRLAFDGSKGRLWVVCRSCERWNLSPLEERWEAIETCERLFSGTRLRTSTENIGLARLPEGLELVRIGAPQRPEFAAWRYGDQFGRRRRNMYIRVGLGLGAMVLLNVGGAAAGIAIGGFSGVFGSMGMRIIQGNPEDVVAKVPLSDGRLLKVRRRRLKSVNLLEAPDGGLQLQLPEGKRDRILVTGADAQRAMELLLPAMNRRGGSRRTVGEAVKLLEDAGDPARYVAHVARFATQKEAKALRSLPYEARLGLEMATHEDSERRALEGELARLEEEWRQAEELAGISDTLLQPTWMDSKLETLRSGGSADAQEA
ncbi:MAG TPA: hypothetical protein VF832_16440 [Longimicrobiales bacterium]